MRNCDIVRGFIGNIERAEKWKRDWNVAYYYITPLTFNESKHFGKRLRCIG